MQEPDWGKIASELKRKGVTLTLLWQEYRGRYLNGYGYTWFCEASRRFRTARQRHLSGRARPGKTNSTGGTVSR